ncbi:ZIP family metal transporter [Mucilaginibacter pedocola]|uniref:Transporter n=1 Tax=Mucilaginibacter pedocola TaxID=1792845 RepID=A0A1S9P8Q0_9SPHI|nr:transporter [Mucilaginibacter pedocola]OOQ57346.1 transporter [Mucilaginibacter pedocola]
MSRLFQEVLLTVIPVLLLLCGGTLAVFRTASAAFKSMTLHFAAGVVFSVVAVELLPDMVKLHDPITIVIGFTVGIASMLLVKQYTEKLEKKAVTTQSGQSLPWAALIAIAIDLLIDGILLGIGFAAGEKEGLLLAVALALECFSLGIAVITTLRSNTNSSLVFYKVLAGLGVIFIVGAVAGLFLLHNANDKVMELILSFGSAALLYLVTEELLVEAHEEKDSPLFTALFFAGFLIFLILGIIL